MSASFETAVNGLIAELSSFERNRDKISSCRAALARLRQSIQNPIHAAPYVAPFAVNVSGDQEDLLYLAAGLFVINPIHTEGVSFGAAFRHLREKSDSIEKRFSMVLAARKEQLPDLLRHSIKLLGSHGLGLDWKMLLHDADRWDLVDSAVQRRWARDFYREPARSAN
ncbi:type I-E CRISPR-associated protein Cse2/CasB [Heliobacterium undosum]|uniref:Type I-E CRISPR-associated protein Cse2/CasB n=1 Tax=Heliomicrobium undosum TaxID=121734 RepID=A0A845L1H7_9FIRM|nr:type I-E CRISPR-associated protein Cse2/CasB [Heliomicrobium undosum]MZP30367.1 type I-E CRISPR-associated protein Cse2/CasB [Heliomicrobium undosum]